jgi:hypothetical protein
LFIVPYSKEPNVSKSGSVWGREIPTPLSPLEVANLSHSFRNIVFFTISDNGQRAKSQLAKAAYIVVKTF